MHSQQTQEQGSIHEKRGFLREIDRQHTPNAAHQLRDSIGSESSLFLARYSFFKKEIEKWKAEGAVNRMSSDPNMSCMDQTHSYQVVGRSNSTNKKALGRELVMATGSSGYGNNTQGMREEILRELELTSSYQGNNHTQQYINASSMVLEGILNESMGNQSYGDQMVKQNQHNGTQGSNSGYNNGMNRRPNVVKQSIGIVQQPTNNSNKFAGQYGHAATQGQAEHLYNMKPGNSKYPGFSQNPNQLNYMSANASIEETANKENSRPHANFSSSGTPNRKVLQESYSPSELNKISGPKGVARPMPRVPDQDADISSPSQNQKSKSQTRPAGLQPKPALQGASKLQQETDSSQTAQPNQGQPLSLTPEQLAFLSHLPNALNVISQLKHKISTLRHEMGLLTTENSALKTHSAKNEEETRAKDSNLGLLRRQVAQMVEERSHLMAEVANLRAQHIDQANNSEGAHRTILSLEKENMELKEKIKQLKVDDSVLQSILREMVFEKSQMTQNLNSITQNQLQHLSQGMGVDVMLSNRPTATLLAQPLDNAQFMPKAGVRTPLSPMEAYEYQQQLPQFNHKPTATSNTFQHMQGYRPPEMYHSFGDLAGTQTAH